MQTITDNWELINQTKTVYLAYDCELIPRKISTDLKEIQIFCKYNYCQWSEYPPKTYSSIA